MTAQIQIVKGAYRNFDAAGKVFELVEQYKQTARGGYVTVVNGGAFPGFPDQIRIKVDGIDCYNFIGNEGHQLNKAIEFIAGTKESAPVETDDEVMERIRQRFEILDEMSTAATNGDIRAMIVSGPPGVGKSYGVERIVEKACLFDQISGKRLRAEVVKGSASALGLYTTLYKYSDSNCVLVFDDCDSILVDDVALALDFKERQKLANVGKKAKDLRFFKDILFPEQLKEINGMIARKLSVKTIEKYIDENIKEIKNKISKNGTRSHHRNKRFRSSFG